MRVIFLGLPSAARPTSYARERQFLGSKLLGQEQPWSDSRSTATATTTTGNVNASTSSLPEPTFLADTPCRGVSRQAGTYAPAGTKPANISRPPCIMVPGATLPDIKPKKIFQSTAMISTTMRSRHTRNSKPPWYMVRMRIPMRLRQLDHLPIPFSCLVAIILSAKGLETFTTETSSMQTISAVHRQACPPPEPRIPPADTYDHSISRNSECGQLWSFHGTGNSRE